MALGMSAWMYVVTLVPVLVLLSSSWAISRRASLAAAAVTIVASFSVFIGAISDRVGARRSGETVLRCIGQASELDTVRVSVLDSDDYSLFFYARAWEEELPKPTQVTFFSSQHSLEHLTSE